MLKSLVLLVAAGLCVSSGASALEVQNGIITNGIITNGIITNGIITNGIITNGIITNGADLNGAASQTNSAPVHASAVILKDGARVTLK